MNRKNILPEILYIDKNDIYYKSLKKNNGNYKLSIVNNYKDALNAILNNNYDLIVINYRIKDINVHNFIKSLEINNIKIPFIVISKSAKISEIIGLFGLGAKDFILKNKKFTQTIHDSIIKNLKNIQIESSIKQEALDNRKYKALVEGASDAIFLQSPYGDIVDCNNAACEMFGYTKEEILKKHIAEFVSEEYLESLPEIITEKNTTLGIPREDIHKRKDGTFFPVVFSTKMIEVENNTYVLVYIKDITKIKRVEENLKISEKKLRSLFKVMQDIVIELDDTGKYIFISETATNLLYKPRNELLGKTLHQVFSKEQADFFLNGIKRALKENDVVTLEYPLKINNKNIWFEARLTPYSEHSVLYIGRDITQRKKDERIKETIFNISNTINYSENQNELFQNIQFELGKIINTNNFYIALYNKSTNKVNFPFVVDEYDIDFFQEHENTLSSYLIKSGKSMLLTKNQIISIENQEKIKFYGTIPEIFLGVPLKNDDGEAVGMIGMFDYYNKNAYNEEDKKILEFVSNQINRTIQRKKLEIDLFNSKNKAEESDRLKSAFLANMSHEIRTPMNSILGFSELLLNFEQSHDETQKYIKIIQKNGLHLLNLINDIIDISKIEAGAMIISKSKFSVNKILSDLHNNFKADNKIIKNNIDLILDTNLSDKDSMIFTDDLKLRQILTNLLSNAIKNISSGFIKFGYKKIIDEKDKKYYLKFFVQDTGIGISKYDQEIIFKRFRQANISKTRLQEGTGLGLALCKNLTELLGGSIWVEAEINKGSTFFFTIPYITQSDN
ncbi:MAG: PAS domain S-box protein [Bacteroidales bacterium]|nr:PAS domain S-box protein [Bacteroidales bacterium]